jgi:hypothetical protein
LALQTSTHDDPKQMGGPSAQHRAGDAGEQDDLEDASPSENVTEAPSDRRCRSLHEYETRNQPSDFGLVGIQACDRGQRTVDHAGFERANEIGRHQGEYDRDKSLFGLQRHRLIYLFTPRGAGSIEVRTSCPLRLHTSADHPEYS